MYSCISVCSNHKYMLSITVIRVRMRHHNLPKTKTVCALKLLWWIQLITKDKIWSLSKAFELSFSYMYTGAIYQWSWKAQIYNSILQLKRIKISIFLSSPPHIYLMVETRASNAGSTNYLEYCTSLVYRLEKRWEGDRMVGTFLAECNQKSLNS